MHILNKRQSEIYSHKTNSWKPIMFTITVAVLRFYLDCVPDNVQHTSTGCLDCFVRCLSYYVTLTEN